jgi:hypothetical protein
MGNASRLDNARLSDLIFDAFYSAGIGGSAVALYFLVADMLAGAPLLTPTILGSSLFLGADASSVSSVHLDAVAYYSVFHLAACGAIGTLVAVMVHAIERMRGNMLGMMVATFVLLQAGFLAFATLAMPAVVGRIGLVQIGAANLLAATSVALFLRSSRKMRAASVLS